MTNSICCLVKIIEKDERVIAAVQFGIKLFNFFTGLNSLLIIFIQVYTVNYQNALDRLRVRMNIILYSRKTHIAAHVVLSSACKGALCACQKNKELPNK